MQQMMMEIERLRLELTNVQAQMTEASTQQSLYTGINPLFEQQIQELKVSNAEGFYKDLEKLSKAEKYGGGQEEYIDWATHALSMIGTLSADFAGELETMQVST